MSNESLSTDEIAELAIATMRNMRLEFIKDLKIAAALLVEGRADEALRHLDNKRRDLEFLDQNSGREN